MPQYAAPHLHIVAVLSPLDRGLDSPVGDTTSAFVIIVTLSGRTPVTCATVTAPRRWAGGEVSRLIRDFRVRTVVAAGLDRLAQRALAAQRVRVLEVSGGSVRDVIELVTPSASSLVVASPQLH